jgi:AcrR family transcriptional regulator
MAKARTPRGAWIEAALAALAEGGPDAVRVERLAKRLGVSKGGFYWHFDDRGALIDEALDAWERSGTEDVIATVEAEPGDPRAKLRRLFELAPAARGSFAVDLALRDVARRDRAVAKRLRRVDRRRMEFLRSLFRGFCNSEDEVEARALLAYSLFIGSYFVDSGHDRRGRRQITQLAVEHLLE